MTARTLRKDFLLVGMALLSLTSCVSDDEQNQSTKKGIQYSGPVTSAILEQPALKGGNSILITHKAVLNDNNQKEEVNYCTEWDTDKTSQRWSCYKLYASITGSSVSRYYATNDGSLSPSCQYPNDPDLSEAYRLSSDPYKSSGYDHGHICPSADRQKSAEANYQTFYITNMQPQYNDFNAKIWASMEKSVRTWASKFDTLYICKGGTIDKKEHILEYVLNRSHQNTQVNKNYIPVPRYFFMALLGRYRDTWMATAFWIDQSNYSSNTLSKYAISIADLERNTGIDFFTHLPDDLEEQVENVSQEQMLNDWY